MDHQVDESVVGIDLNVLVWLVWVPAEFIRELILTGVGVL